MLKNTKRLLAIMLAVAVVAMSMFTGVAVSATSNGTVDLLEFGDYLTEMGSTSKYYDTNVADNGETGASWDDPIIIDSAEEFVYIAKTATNDTAGKYYKVADGIAAFDLSGGLVDPNGSLADELANIQGSSKNHAGGAPGFQGHFDGNGVTVYGAWTNHTEGNVSPYAGLFSCTQGDVTIKNVNVKFASFTATSAVGGIVGYHKGDGTNTLTIENCSITDSHLEYVGTGGFGHGIGAILGYSANLSSWKEADKGVDGNGDGDMVDTIYVNGAINIKNCYVNLDEEYFISIFEPGMAAVRGCHGGIAGFINTNAMKVSDCVVIGITPYATQTNITDNDVQHSGLESRFANIYTTENVAITDVFIGGNANLGLRNFTGKVYALSDAQLKGEAALSSMNLDWSVWMADDEDYPELRTMHKDVTFVDNGDGTHNEVCACGFGGISAEHIWNDGVCACGAILDCAGRETIYWDGTIATGIATGSGAKEDPYIINSAAEFAWLIQQKADVTTGKYYKIADNIKNIVLQEKEFAEDIMALGSADDVQAFFEDISYIFHAWPTVAWEGSCFAGIFDGNGATVYGLYQVSNSNAGLFSTIDGGAHIKNIALKNSYMTSTAGNYQVGGIAAVTSSGPSYNADGTLKSEGYGVKANGAIWFEGCVVANNYMYNSSTSHDRSGVIIGASSEVVYMDNCLVYGNNATYGDGVAMPVWSNGNNSIIVGTTTAIPEGLEMVDDGAETNPRYYNMIRNSVIMGTTPYDAAQQVGSRFNDPKCFKNVYTDVAANTFFTNVTVDQIKTVTVGELAAISLGDAWLNTTTYPELAAFHDSGLVVTPNNDGTHGSVCSCGTVFTAPCTFVDGACSVCEADLNCASKRTIYWNGGIAASFADTSAGTKDDPIIINSADELAYLIGCKADVTKDKYFEIAEDIGTIVLQAEDLASEILALDSAADVQALFESSEYVFTEWPEKAWEASCFAGNFDGNGVKIYGLYIVSDTNAALFPTVDAGASIHNVAVLNSYLYSLSTSANYQVGAIAATTSNGAYGTGEQGIVWFNGCTVGNCYMRNDAPDANRSGVIFGTASQDSIAIDNCLVYGNDARHSVTKGDHSLEMSLYAQALNGTIAPARVPEGLVVKTQEDATTGNQLYYNTVRNTIAFGTNIMNTNVEKSYRRNDPGCFENNYTDGAAGTVAFTNGEWTYEESQIKFVTLETLNDNDLGSAWIKTDSYPELKVYHDDEFVLTDNGDGTHSSACSCGLKGASADHTYVEGVCACGAECAHTNKNEAVIENDVKPDCTNDGSYDSVVYCADCGKEISRVTTVVNSLGHSDGEAVEENIVDATCIAQGSYESVVYCTVCGEEVSREKLPLDIDPDNHTYSDFDDVDCDDCGHIRELYKLGDTDGSGEVDNKDYALLMQHINGWDVEINEGAADVYKDGKIDNKDYAILMQWLNGWDVTLGEQA